ncbi:hypothetical protein WBU86_27600 [Escherichia coli]
MFRFNVIAVSLIALLLLLSGETEEGVVMAAIACGLIPTNKILLHFTPSSISTVRKSRVINPASRRRFSASAVSFPETKLLSKRLVASLQFVALKTLAISQQRSGVLIPDLCRAVPVNDL